MRTLIVALAVSYLAGCSNVTDIRSMEPVLSTSSARPAKAVAECIRDGWQSISVFGGSVGGVLQQSGDMFSVVAPSGESPWHVADISPAGSGSAVKYRFYRSWQSPNDSITKVVSDCSK